jgi:hypothetical protein
MKINKPKSMVNWLKEWLSSPDDYYSTREIMKMLKEKGINTTSDNIRYYIRTLSCSNIMGECPINGKWVKCYGSRKAIEKRKKIEGNAK